MYNVTVLLFYGKGGKEMWKKLTIILFILQ